MRDKRKYEDLVHDAVWALVLVTAVITGLLVLGR